MAPLSRVGARTKKPDALQGTLDLLVLKTLSRSPQHGYGIATHIQQVSGDMLRVEEGSLYPALHRMEHSGWVAAEWHVTANNRRARVYRITRTGLRQLEQVEDKWAELTAAVARVLKYT
jgi:PadR family transcriptional regulator, regulatory protein PadR